MGYKQFDPIEVTIRTQKMTLPDGLNLVHRVFDNGWLLVDKYLLQG